MLRSIRKSQAVILAGLIVSAVVYALLATGIFTLTEYTTYYISSFVLAELSLLLLVSTTLKAYYHKETWRAITPYLTVTAVGCVGMLVDLLISVLLNPSLTLPLEILVAIEFFFLVLTLGGEYLLVTEYSKWSASQACVLAENKRA